MKKPRNIVQLEHIRMRRKAGKHKKTKKALRKRDKDELKSKLKEGRVDDVW